MPGQALSREALDLRDTQLHKLRECWEFAASLHFLQTFSPQQGINLVRADELEEYLLGPKAHSEQLTSIFRSLLVPNEDAPAIRKHFKETEWEVLLFEAFASARSLDLFEYNPLQGSVDVTSVDVTGFLTLRLWGP
mgnify:CR=1 FL=1